MTQTKQPPANTARFTGLPVLEINPRHALIARLAAKGSDIAETAGPLLDPARLQDGNTPRDSATFARRVAQALAVG